MRRWMAGLAAVVLFFCFVSVTAYSAWQVTHGRSAARHIQIKDKSKTDDAFPMLQPIEVERTEGGSDNDKPKRDGNVKRASFVKAAFDMSREKTSEVSGKLTRAAEQIDLRAIGELIGAKLEQAAQQGDNLASHGSSQTDKLDSSAAAGARIESAPESLAPTNAAPASYSVQNRRRAGIFRWRVRRCGR